MKINIKEMLKERGVSPQEAMHLIMESALAAGQFMLEAQEDPSQAVAFSGTDEKTNKKFQLIVREVK